MAPTRRLQKCCLPEDVTVEILSRLPVKTLLRFKSVCSQWRSLISSPLFVSVHLNRSISNPSRNSILFQRREKENPIFLSYSVTLSPIETFISGVDQFYCFGPQILGAINGLLCVIRDSSNSVCIWNPATRMFKTVPLGRSPFFYTIGFGWDPIADDYKVVKIDSDSEGQKIKTWAKVWSSNLDSWREVKVDGNFIFDWPVCDVMVNGVAYWIVKDDFKTGSKTLVASFDMSTEVLQLVSLPEHLLQRVSVMKTQDRNLAFYGMNLKESFAIVGLVSLEPKKTYELWTMENDTVGKEPWSKKFTFELDIEFHNFICPVNGKIILDRGGGEVMIYDVETRETKSIVIQDAGIIEDGLVVPCAGSLVESLVSIKGFSSLGYDGANEN